MTNLELVNNGLVPQYINEIQAAKVADDIQPRELIDMLKHDDRIEYKEINPNNYEINTLSLLNYLDDFHEHCVALREQQFRHYLMVMKQLDKDPRLFLTTTLDEFGNDSKTKQMDNKELVKNGLIDEYITVKTAAPLVAGRNVESVNRLIENNAIQTKKNDSGDYEVNTLSLLKLEKASNTLFSKELKQERIKSLKKLKKEKV